MNCIKTYDGDQVLTHEEIIELSLVIKVIIYARVSTADQARKGYSIPSQVETGVEYSLKKGFDKNEIMAVLEKGEMGDDPNRPGLNMVLNLVEKGVGKILVMLHPDRLSRYLLLQNEIAHRVWSAGCELGFVEFEIDPSNPESMLNFNIQGSISQYNKAKIHANTKRGRRQKVKEGKLPGFRRIFGYYFDKEEDILVENSYEKKIYQLMVDWLLNGKDGEEMNCSKIAQQLATEGFQPPESNKWYQSTVSRILRNETYLGTLYWGKTEIKQSNGQKEVINKPREEWLSVEIPQYIDQARFDKVQKKLDQLAKRTRGRKSENYMLKSLVRCGLCNRAVVAGAPTTLKSGKKIRYYACSGKTKKNFKVGTGEHNEICTSGYWRQDTVDDYVWFYILGRLRNPEQLISELVKQQGEEGKKQQIKSKINSLEKKLKKKDLERQRCFQAYKEGIIDLENLKKETEPIKAEMAEIEQELLYTQQIYKQFLTSYDEIQQIKESIAIFREMVQRDTFTYDQKREIVTKVIEKVILHENEIEIITKWMPENNLGTHSNLNNSQSHGGLQGSSCIYSCRLYEGNGMVLKNQSWLKITISYSYRVSQL